MRELSGHVTHAEPSRLAILAALNLADELSRNRRSWDGERGAIEARVTELKELLDRALLGSEVESRESLGRAGTSAKDRVGLELLDIEKSARKRSKASNKNESRGTP